VFDLWRRDRSNNNRARLFTTTVDFLVRVSQADGNFNPPELTFESSLIPSVAPSTTRQAPMSIQCGRNTFSTPAVSTNSVRIGVRDIDSNTAGRTQQCTFEPQSITWVATAADLPRGVVLGNLTYLPGGANTGLAYIDLSWRPQCEDLSQVKHPHRLRTRLQLTSAYFIMPVP
jgi:hypothetical protein